MPLKISIVRCPLLRGAQRRFKGDPAQIEQLANQILNPLREAELELADTLKFSSRRTRSERLSKMTRRRHFRTKLRPTTRLSEKVSRR